MIAQGFRGLGLANSVQRHLQVKQRERGLQAWEYVESFLLLNALGGDCLDDFAALREDQTLAELIGHAMPSPEAARKFLYAFHDEGNEAAEPPWPGTARLRVQSARLGWVKRAFAALSASVEIRYFRGDSAWLTSIPPYLDFQTYRVCFDTPTSRATSSAVRPASICFSAAIIRASLCMEIQVWRHGCQPGAGSRATAG